MMVSLSIAMVLATTPPLPAGKPSAIVWFDLGHRVVARIAESRLTPSAAAAVKDLLAGVSMADASVWADEIRGARRETAQLHYVNIPLAATRYDSAAQCPAGCIISAISADRRVLADPSATPGKRTEALKFLIHLVGDLHQPLHVADHGDRGGNEVAVYFFESSSNLHQVWDGKLIEEKGYREDTYLAHLTSQKSSLDLHRFESGSVIDWAMEGHALAVKYAYRWRVGNRIGDSYEDTSLPVVDLAIIKAGVRLAAVLNAALADYQPGPRAPSSVDGSIADREAAGHIGEDRTVVGTVISVHGTASGNVHINFGAEYPHQSFSVYIEHPADSALLHLDSLAGKRVGVRGVIRLFKGSPEIKVTSRSQIVVQP